MMSWLEVWVAQPLSVCATAAGHGEPLDRLLDALPEVGRFSRLVLNWPTRLAAIS
jgi:hypothetical protein